MFASFKFLSKKENMMENYPPIYIGCMTGTSIDNKADFTAAIFDNEGQVIAYANSYINIEKKLLKKLHYIVSSNPLNINIVERAEIETEFTLFLANAYQAIIKEFNLAKYPKEKIILSPHGQAINHCPDNKFYFSDIILNGDILSNLTGYKVVSRHRQAALTISNAAPLIPVLIKNLFPANEQNIIYLNGGGIANITVMFCEEPNNIIGFDTGPANCMLNGYIRYILETNKGIIPTDLYENIIKHKCDYNGLWASRGKIINDLYELIMQNPYFSKDISRKSANRSDFSIKHYLDEINKYLPEHVLATLSAVVIDSITYAIKNIFEEKQISNNSVFISYGGLTHNIYIMNAIKSKLQKIANFSFDSIENHGFETDYFESLLMAFLGCQAYNHKAINLSYCKKAGTKDNECFAVPGSIHYPSQ